MTAADIAGKFGPVVAGLLIGSAAKYGLTLSEGAPVTWRGVLADILLLGMLGLLSIVVSDYFNLAGNARVLTASLAAVGGDRLIRLVRERFFKRAETELNALAPSAGANDAG